MVDMINDQLKAHLTGPSVNGYSQSSNESIHRTQCGFRFVTFAELAAAILDI